MDSWKGLADTMRTHTDGHIASVVLILDRSDPGRKSPVPEYRRPGVVRLLDHESRALGSWPVLGTSSTYEWVYGVMTGNASGQFEAGEHVVVLERAQGVNLLAIYEPWVNGEPSLISLFSVDDDVVLTIVEG